MTAEVLSQQYRKENTMAKNESEALVKIAVVMPCFKVKDHVLPLIQRIGPEVDRIYVIDDCCPQKTGSLVESSSIDSRLTVIYNVVNQGVGGAVIEGYRRAIADGCTVIVKIDGDGQMDPVLIGRFVAPIINGEADYTKGNRFFSLENVTSMPTIRKLGNAALSFMAKFSTGYWNIFDPTNGYTAIDARVAANLPLEKISHRYFFETDLLFRLNTLRAVVVDIPMSAYYGEEVSNLKIHRVLLEFLIKHMRNAGKRIFYNYYLRDMSVASLELPLGIFLLLFGLGYGSIHWLEALGNNTVTAPGTVMLAALPVIVGIQLLLNFLNFDVASVPSRVIYPRLIDMKTNQRL